MDSPLPLSPFRPAETPDARFEELYAEHYTRVLGYVLRRAPTAVAGNVVADVFLVGGSCTRCVRSRGRRPVVDIVYVADNLPLVPEARIVARDTAGDVVWHQAVGAAVQPAPSADSCGLG